MKTLGVVYDTGKLFEVDDEWPYAEVDNGYEPPAQYRSDLQPTFEDAIRAIVEQSLAQDIYKVLPTPDGVLLFGPIRAERYEFPPGMREAWEEYWHVQDYATVFARDIGEGENLRRKGSICYISRDQPLVLHLQEVEIFKRSTERTGEPSACILVPLDQVSPEEIEAYEKRMESYH